jgi:hypothetical protein
VIKTVWKFPLEINDEQDVTMPANSHILCVQVQGVTPCLWALCSPEMPEETRKILITGTGHEREDLAGFVPYIGSFQLAGGALVFHVFESVAGSEIAPSSELIGAAHA